MLVQLGDPTYLSGEVTDDVGGVTTPQGPEALSLDGTREAVADALVRFRQATGLDHLVLVLDEKLHTLDRRSSCLGDGGRHTTHEKVDGEGGQISLLASLLSSSRHEKAGGGTRNGNVHGESRVHEAHASGSRHRRRLGGSKRGRGQLAAQKCLRGRMLQEDRLTPAILHDLHSQTYRRLDP